MGCEGAAARHCAAIAHRWRVLRTSRSRACGKGNCDHGLIQFCSLPHSNLILHTCQGEPVCCGTCGEALAWLTRTRLCSARRRLLSRFKKKLRGVELAVLRDYRYPERVPRSVLCAFSTVLPASAALSNLRRFVMLRCIIPAAVLLALSSAMTTANAADPTGRVMGPGARTSEDPPKKRRPKHEHTVRECGHNFMTSHVLACPKWPRARRADRPRRADPPPRPYVPHPHTLQKCGHHFMTSRWLCLPSQY
jgi:hypothetical protein